MNVPCVGSQGPHIICANSTYSTTYTVGRGDVGEIVQMKNAGVRAEMSSRDNT